jgi:hypothetical protein
MITAAGLPPGKGQLIFMPPSCVLCFSSFLSLFFILPSVLYTSLCETRAVSIKTYLKLMKQVTTWPLQWPSISSDLWIVPLQINYSGTEGQTQDCLVRIISHIISNYTNTAPVYISDVTEHNIWITIILLLVFMLMLCGHLLSGWYVNYVSKQNTPRQREMKKVSNFRYYTTRNFIIWTHHLVLTWWAGCLDWISIHIWMLVEKPVVKWLRTVSSDGLWYLVLLKPYSSVTRELDY